MKIKPLYVIIIALIALTSCTDDNPVSPDESDPRDKFIGTWLINESEDIKVAYTINILHDPNNSAQVVIKNFGNLGSNNSAKALVTSKTLTIMLQEITLGVKAKGSGNLSSPNEISFKYTIAIGGDENNYKATAKKKQ